jgi:hypothetical protein
MVLLLFSLIVLPNSLLIVCEIHGLTYGACEGFASTPARTIDATDRVQRATTSSMCRLQHATSTINAILDDEEVVIARELMLVYAMQPAFLGCAA